MVVRVARFIRWFAVVGAALVLVACGGPNVPLTGTITDAYTGKPIPAATVKVGWDTAKADASGKYQIANWGQKDTLQINADGYDSATIALDGLPQLAKPTPPAALLDSKIRPNTLNGTITDTYTGKPLAGALIKVSDTISATTDTSGHFGLKGLPERFNVTLSARDYAPLTQSIERTTTFAQALRPSLVTGKVTDQYTGAPLAKAQVKAGSTQATTGADGVYRLENVPENATLEVTVDGYSMLSQPIEKQTAINAVLRPDILKGKLVNAKTGAPIAFATVFAATALGADDASSTELTNSADGSFTLEGLPEHGVLYVMAPGYKRAEVEIKPGNVPAEIKLEPFQVKAWYVTAAVASRKQYLFDEYFSVIDKTELNTIIIDLKSDLRDDLGLVYYDSQAPMVKELRTSADYMDLPGILAEAKKRGIYTIARVQLFSHDNVLADKRPDWTTKDRETGKTYADYPGPGIRYAYLDPTNKNVWEYNIQLGEEAARLGFDEVNYDYVRFSDWYGDLTNYSKKLQFSEPIDPKTNPDLMFNTINGFMEAAHGRLNKAGAFMSVDFFGRVALRGSLPIAQDIKLGAANADYICPMIYPSLWWQGYLDLDNPTAHPYEVIAGTLKTAALQFAGKRAVNRPWLQDHTDPWAAHVVEYGPKEVRAQIDATEAFDPTMGWMLYNSANAYHDEAVKPE